MNILKALEVFGDKNVTIEVTRYPKGGDFFVNPHYRVRFLYHDFLSRKYQKDNVIMGEMINDMVCCDFFLTYWAKEFNDYINEKSTDITTDASPNN